MLKIVVWKYLSQPVTVTDLISETGKPLTYLQGSPFMIWISFELHGFTVACYVANLLYKCMPRIVLLPLQLWDFH